MRFKKKEKTGLPKYGEFRQVSRFLFLPKTINEETRWLELGHWVEMYQDKWHTIRWLEGYERVRNGKIVKVMVR